MDVRPLVVACLCWSAIAAGQTSGHFYMGKDSDVAASPPPPQITIDLHPQGFPSAPEFKFGVFYPAKDRLALFFDQQLPGGEPHSHTFQLMILDTNGQKTAQLVVHGDPKAMDITAGPGGASLSAERVIYESKWWIEVDFGG